MDIRRIVEATLGSIMAEFSKLIFNADMRDNLLVLLAERN